MSLWYYSIQEKNVFNACRPGASIPRPAGHPKLLKWPVRLFTVHWLVNSCLRCPTNDIENAARACTRTVLFRLFVYLTSTYYVVTVKHAVTHKWLCFRICACFARAMILCFHFKFSIEYGKQATKNNKKIRYDFSNRFYDRSYIVIMVLNFGPGKLLKSRYGPSL